MCLPVVQSGRIVKRVLPWVIQRIEKHERVSKAGSPWSIRTKSLKQLKVMALSNSTETDAKEERKLREYG